MSPASLAVLSAWARLVIVVVVLMAVLGPASGCVTTPPATPTSPPYGYQRLDEFCTELSLDVDLNEATGVVHLSRDGHRFDLCEGMDTLLIDGQPVLMVGRVIKLDSVLWLPDTAAVDVRRVLGAPMAWAPVPGSPASADETPVTADPEYDEALPDGVRVRRGRRWKYIVLHHSATTSGNATVFDRAHRKRGWENGLGYHFVIGNGNGSGDGTIEVGPRWRKQLQGAHAGVKLYNNQGIGICMVGNFEDSVPTPRQLAALKKLVRFLRDKYGIVSERIVRHRDVKKGTACPGWRFPLKWVRR